MLDILFDYFLANQWDAFYEEPLEAFSARTLANLVDMGEDMPERAAQTLTRMHASNSLARYGESIFVKNSFSYLAKRLKRENPLPDAFEASVPHLPVLSERFAEFFPEAMGFCDEWRNNQ
ncbi:MAG: acyl carrier protein phosphodiesterase [Candidatus Azotimanducaceae bacterium]|jgi:acyl carrier protein phosphodiesterase